MGLDSAILQLLRGARLDAAVAAPSDDTIPFTLHLGGNVTAAELAPCGNFAVIAVPAADDAPPVALPRLTGHIAQYSLLHSRLKQGDKIQTMYQRAEQSLGARLRAHRPAAPP